jgi:hypothetical protein
VPKPSKWIYYALFPHDFKYDRTGKDNLIVIKLPVSEEPVGN